MKKAIVDNGIVANVIVADPDFEIEGVELVPLPDDSPVATGWLYESGTFISPDAPRSLEESKAAKIAEVNALRDDILAQGAEVAPGLHVPLSDGSRADLGGMATTAIGVLLGALSWPPDYATGWITTENVRIPLPAPSDGLALASAVGARYAAVVQAARNIKDAILVAATPEELAAIDISEGWPA